MALTPKIRTIIVGYGPNPQSRGSFHGKNIARSHGYEIVGICDHSELGRNRAATEFPNVPVFPRFEKGVEECAPELVVICTPPDSHCHLAVEAMRRGAHVAVEKPMSLTPRDADEMIEESRRCEKILTVLHNRRWDSDYLLVKEHINSGVFGKVFCIDSTVDQLIRPSGWRADPTRGGGHLYDWGPHLVDQIIDLLGEGPQWLIAYTNDLGWRTGVDTWARLLMEFSAERLVTVQVASNAWMKRARWHVYGEKGGMLVSGKKFSLIAQDKQLEGDVPWKRPPNFWEHLRRVMAGQEDLWIRPEQGRMTVKILEAAMESANSGNRQMWLDRDVRRNSDDV